jgi:hypothetical protein
MTESWWLYEKRERDQIDTHTHTHLYDTCSISVVMDALGHSPD